MQGLFLWTSDSLAPRRSLLYGKRIFKTPRARRLMSAWCGTESGGEIYSPPSSPHSRLIIPLNSIIRQISAASPSVSSSRQLSARSPRSRRDASRSTAWLTWLPYKAWMIMKVSLMNERDEQHYRETKSRNHHGWLNDSSRVRVRTTGSDMHGGVPQ